MADCAPATHVAQNDLAAVARLVRCAADRHDLWARVRVLLAPLVEQLQRRFAAPRLPRLERALLAKLGRHRRVGAARAARTRRLDRIARAKVLAALLFAHR